MYIVQEQESAEKDSRKDQGPSQLSHKYLDSQGDEAEIALRIADSQAATKLASQGSAYQRFFPQLKQFMRKVNLPSMLTLYCNTIEILRLR